MDTLRLKPRQPVEDPVENWDDDGDFALEDEVSFRSVSSATNAQSGAHRRDSHSSHLSFRSELESLHGEEEKQVLLPGDDEKSTLDAIAAAATAGIPIPKNVPPSALMGGTIKRLGGRTLKKFIQDDWENDLEFPDASQGLHIKQQDASKFPEVLRQVSGGSQIPSPVKTSSRPTIVQANQMAPPPKPARLSGAIDLDRFRDNDEDDDDFFGDGSATIKVSKSRQPPKPISMITPPTPQKKEKSAEVEDDFENDFELPSNGRLKLSTRKEIPKTPSMNTDDIDWGEGSLGTRYGGTRRDARSNRSSSASALSPSVSSSITAESEDETFDGLQLPHGPFNFGERLKMQQRTRSPGRIPEEPVAPPPPSSVTSTAKSTPAAEADREDFMTGLDIGDGEVFDAGKLTLHRNIKVKEARPASPARPKTAVSLTFTNKPVSSTQSRLPRPSHERAQSNLEPVSESGDPILQKTRRSQSRLGHSAQSSVSSIATPTTPSSVQSLPPSTPRRQNIVNKSSNVSLRNEPTTTSAQLLRLKRSLPAMRAPQSPAKPITSRFERPPSRTDGRPPSAMRPKTPVERTRTTESAAAQARRNPLPFLPAGASATQSQHVMTKSSRTFRRHDSDNSIELRPNSRAISRSTMRSPSPRRLPGIEKAGTGGTWSRLAEPKRRRNFGDGHELDGFDDLPVSRDHEARYMRQPAIGPKTQAFRNKVYQQMPDRTSTPSPLTPYSPHPSYTPHFARDTAASRIAREASLAQRAPPTGPLAPLTTQRVAQLSARSHNPILPQATVRSKKSLRKPPQLKPHLISNLGGGKESKMVNGMFYNPVTMRWEGNENVLSAFDAPASSPSTASMPHLLRERENSTPRPGLITNIGTKGVQVVSGMVFDPQNMCWLKLGPSNGKSDASDPMDGFNALDDDEDVFKDIPDLEDNNTTDSNEGAPGGRVSDVKDDWLVGEEFDVGPEFVRRQREEEDRWRKKCEKWLSTETRDQHSWRWAIREMVLGDGN